MGASFLPRCPAAPLPRCPAAPLPRCPAAPLWFPTDAPIPHRCLRAGAYLDEPSPRSLSDQWSRVGWGVLNYGRYGNPVFDSLLERARRETDVASARRQWREAMDTLNADAPAIFLYALANRAAVQRRLENVKLDPYSWLSGLREWRIDPERALGRDSLR